MLSPALTRFLEPYKKAAAEGAALELKMRLLAGIIPALKAHAHSRALGDIEADLIAHFGTELSEEDGKQLTLCRQLRNKVLHSDFHAARGTLNELGNPPSSGGVVKIDLPIPTVAEFEKKIEAAKAGREGIPVADTSSTGEGGVYGWFLEAGMSGDFVTASRAFKDAAKIIERLTELEATRDIAIK